METVNIARLRALSNFLKTSFKGASFGQLKIDECVAALDDSILEKERTVIMANEIRKILNIGPDDSCLLGAKAAMDKIELLAKELGIMKTQWDNAIKLCVKRSKQIEALEAQLSEGSVKKVYKCLWCKDTGYITTYGNTTVTPCSCRTKGQ